MTSYGAIDEPLPPHHSSSEAGRQNDDHDEEEQGSGDPHGPLLPLSRSVDYLSPIARGSSSNRNTGAGSGAARRQPYLFSAEALSRNISQLSIATTAANNSGGGGSGDAPTRGGGGVERATSTSTTMDQSTVDELISRQHNMAIRYRLFNRLDPGGSHLTMPAHVVIQSELFSVLPFDEFKDREGKQGSVVTIFSIWNTMMGTSLLAMPWALQQAGLVLGLFLMLFIAFIAVYTAYRVVESPSGLTMGEGIDAASAEFSDVCRYFWGRRGEVTAVFFSVAVLVGGVIVYFVLMSNFLYHTGNVFYEALQPNSSILPVMFNNSLTCDVYCPSNLKQNTKEALFGSTYRDHNKQYSSTLKCEHTSLPCGEGAAAESEGSSFEKFWRLQGSVPLILALMAFPLLNFKSPTFFTKFNMLGTISILYLIFFTLSKAVECGVNVRFGQPSSEHYVQLFNWKFPALTGTLALSYFIHNAILTILRNQKHPENNARDLFIGYVLAAFCYTLIGMMFFLAFPAKRSCISDNFLNNFASADMASATARVFLLFQMFTVLPLLMYLIRVQCSYVFTGTLYPGLRYVCLINMGVVAVATFFAMAYPHVGSILRYVGSFSGMIYVFSLPCLVHMKRLQKQGRLTPTAIGIHTTIIALGVANLISQFTV